VFLTTLAFDPQTAALASVALMTMKSPFELVSLPRRRLWEVTEIISITAGDSPACAGAARTALVSK